MPSEPAAPGRITGRCYCGAVHVSALGAPLIVTYCHCSDCRRITGAPVAAFAAFASDAVRITPGSDPVSANAGVQRWFCRSCGSPLAARFDYLPGQTYLPLGILDQAAHLPPTLHCHHASRLPWLDIADTHPRSDASGRAALNSAT